MCIRVPVSVIQFLQACDISARVDAPDDLLARRVLVGTFCELSCRSPSFPRCLMLEVEQLDDSHQTTTEHADTYSGTLGGQDVDLRVPKVMQQCGPRVLESRVRVIVLRSLILY